MFNFYDSSSSLFNSSTGNEAGEAGGVDMRYILLACYPVAGLMLCMGYLLYRCHKRINSSNTSMAAAITANSTIAPNPTTDANRPTNNANNNDAIDLQQITIHRDNQFAAPAQAQMRTT